MIVFWKKQSVFWVLGGALALTASGCDQLWPDKEPLYRYQVKNETSETLQVRLELDATTTSLMGTAVQENTVAPGQLVTIWRRTGSPDEGMVLDYEKNQQRMLYFRNLSITGTRQFRNAKTDFTAPQFWQYHRDKNYEATYLLTVRATDYE